MKIPVASALDETTSLSITYDASWEDCDGTTDWVCGEFRGATLEDQIEVRPAVTRSGSIWDLCLRKENNSLHILIRERLAGGMFPAISEDPGIRAAILYRQKSIIKLRKQTSIAAQILSTFGECAEKLYQGRMRLTEQLQTSELAIVGSLGNDSLSGILPDTMGCKRRLK
jgi:hypothetical protein